MFHSGEPAHRAGVERPGCCRTHRAVGIDQCGPAFEIGGVEQRLGAATGQRHEVGVGDVLVPVGIGKPLRLGDQVHTVDRGLSAIEIKSGRRILIHREVRQDAERRGHRDPTGRRGGHAADLVVPIRHADRLAHLGLVVRQVGDRHLRRSHPVRRRPRFGDDRLRDVATVERLRTVGCDGTQRFRVRRVREPLPRRLGRTIWLQEVASGLWICTEIRGRIVDRRCQSRADGEPGVGKGDSRFEQFAPLGISVLGLHRLEHAQDAGHTDGPATRARVGYGLGPIDVIDPAQVVLGCRGRGHLAAVERLHRPVVYVVVQRERTSADPGALRFDQAQHHLRGDQGIGGVATVCQYLTSSLGRQRIGGGRRERSGLHGSHVRAISRRDLRIRRQVLGGVGGCRRRNRCGRATVRARRERAHV